MKFKIEPAKSECENFWDANAYVVVTDHTKPAIKWAISELNKRGKNTYIIDFSENPEPESLKSVSELPFGLDRAVIGVTKTDPGDLIPSLYEKGIKKIWLHWRTETKRAIEICRENGLECFTERCPMMYLGSNLSIHGMHRMAAKVMGKY